MQVAIAAQASAASPIVATGHARIAAADDLATPGTQVSRRHLSFTLNDGFDLGGITFNDEGDEGNEGDEGAGPGRGGAATGADEGDEGEEGDEGDEGHFDFGLKFGEGDEGDEGGDDERGVDFSRAEDEGDEGNEGDEGSGRSRGWHAGDEGYDEGYDERSDGSMRSMRSMVKLPQFPPPVVLHAKPMLPSVL